MERSELYNNPGKVLNAGGYNTAELFLSDLWKGCKVPNEEVASTLGAKMLAYGGIAVMVSWELGPLGTAAAGLAAGIFATVDTVEDSLAKETKCRELSLAGSLVKSFKNR